MLDGTPETQPPAGVVLVTADRRVRDGLSSLLDASGVARILGTATDPDSAVAHAAAGTATTFVVDPNMANGRTPRGLLGDLRREAPLARIVLIAWDGGSALLQRDGLCDCVVDVADRPSSVIEAIVPGSTGPA